MRDLNLNLTIISIEDDVAAYNNRTENGCNIFDDTVDDWAYYAVTGEM